MATHSEIVGTSANFLVTFPPRRRCEVTRVAQGSRRCALLGGTSGGSPPVNYVADLPVAEAPRAGNAVAER